MRPQSQQQLEKKMSEAFQRIRTAVARGVIDAAGDIRNIAVKRAPVDTGNLRRSAEVLVDGSSGPSMNATSNTRYVTVRFTAPYAGYVHSAAGKLRGVARSPPHRGRYWDPTGAGPKFLAKAVEEVQGRMKVYIKRRIAQVMPRA
ncbi:MAG: HK97 gp10 family phage protein [Bacteroidaceae bacterium]|nr:HK97 gp10 family phage protein [Bacteroidaceae bacterium]